MKTRLEKSKKNLAPDIHGKVKSAFAKYGFYVIENIDIANNLAFPIIAVQFGKVIALDIAIAEENDILLGNFVNLDTFYKMEIVSEKYGIEIGIVIHWKNIEKLVFLPFKLLNSLGENQYYNISISLGQLPSFKGMLEKWRND